MSDFAYIHQDTQLGQILVVNEYDPVEEQHKVSLKFNSDDEGIMIDLAIRTDSEQGAQQMFDGLKDLDRVYDLIKEALPLKIINP